ncbi:hypothetical protein ACTMQQ_28435 [Pseudomonas syringae pv. aptata]|uniref:hypothetical protein n=1 Tax=Pseudomonas syringae TaxID=317 RepID=UPI003F8C8D78
MKQVVTRGCAAFIALVMAPVAFAAGNNDVDLGGNSSGPLQAFVGFLQELVNFVGGPGVLFIAFIAGFAAIGLWVIAPKAGGAAIAWAFRVCAGVIMLMNLALLLTWLQGF